MAEQSKGPGEMPEKLSDRVPVGALVSMFPPDLVDRVVAETGTKEKRCRLLPTRVMVYYVLAMCLFASEPYEEVMALVEGELANAGLLPEDFTTPTPMAISKARMRIKDAPLKALFGTVAQPLATSKTRGAFYRRWLLMAIDGTVLDAAASDDNIEEFGLPRTGRGEGVGAYPQPRIVAITECGTHATVSANIGTLSDSEVTLAPDTFTALRPDMLLLADRGFPGYELWNKARATGADLLWRVSASFKLTPTVILPDGSYLSALYHPKDRKKKYPVVVRVIEYRLSGEKKKKKGDRPTFYRLITTILDPAEAPVEELAALYSERWEEELAIKELKTYQRGPDKVLRSQTPEGVRQEIWGHLLIHYAVRSVIHATAVRHDLDPDSLSYTAAIRLVRRCVANPTSGTPWKPGHIPQDAVDELLRRQRRPRRNRKNPRVVKRKISKFPAKRAHHRGAAQPVRPAAYMIEITQGSIHSPDDQEKLAVVA